MMNARVRTAEFSTKTHCLFAVAQMWNPAALGLWLLHPTADQSKMLIRFS
jgi:hypothetical protein